MITHIIVLLTNFPTQKVLPALVILKMNAVVTHFHSTFLLSVD